MIYNYIYNYVDHLGNVRVSYMKDPADGILKIVDENHYYPFGLKHNGYSSSLQFLEAQTRPPYVVLTPVTNESQATYKIKYLGQERQDELGLNWDTFRHRNYDYAIGRFFGVDPIAEQFMSISTYQFAHNNPVWKIELEGLEGKETQGVDISHHEPIKVQSPNLGFVGGGLTQVKVVQQSTQKVVEKTATEAVKKGGSGFFGTLAKVGGTALALLTDYMSPNYGGRTSEMQITVSNKIQGESVVQNISSKQWGTDEENDDGEIIYRGGNYSANNFTPRVTDTDGLSTNIDPLASTQGKGGKTQGLSSNLLKSMGFQLDKKGKHVSVRPPSQTLLEKWAATKGLAPGTDPAQILTQMVMSARVEELNLPKK